MHCLHPHRASRAIAAAPLPRPLVRMRPTPRAACPLIRSRAAILYGAPNWVTPSALGAHPRPLGPPNPPQTLPTSPTGPCTPCPPQNSHSPPPPNLDIEAHSAERSQPQRDTTLAPAPPEGQAATQGPHPRLAPVLPQDITPSCNSHGRHGRSQGAPRDAPGARVHPNLRPASARGATATARCTYGPIAAPARPFAPSLPAALD